MLNIAHRGGAHEGPENTVAAFAQGVQAGADMAETDLRMTADGEVVLLHDDSVDRTTDGAGPVEELTLAEVTRLDAAHWFVPGQGVCRDAPADAYPYRGVAAGRAAPPDGLRPEDFRVPTLRDLLERFPALPLTFEVKTGPPQRRSLHERVADLLEEHGRVADIIAGAFEDSYLAPLARRLPGLATSMTFRQAAAFVTDPTADPVASETAPSALQVPATYEGAEVVDAALVRRAHASGLVVHVWTVNDRERMERLVDLGVDGIMTDRPTLLEEILTARGLLSGPPRRGAAT